MPRASTSKPGAAAASSSSPAVEARSRRFTAVGTSSRSRRIRTNGRNRAVDNDDQGEDRSDSEDIDDDALEREGPVVPVDPEEQEVGDQEGPAVVADTRDTFYITIYALVRLVPPGRVTTYGKLSGFSTSHVLLIWTHHCPHFLLATARHPIVPYLRMRKAGHLAKLAGRPRNSRLVGQALKFLPRRMGIPPAELPPPPAGQDPDLAAPDPLANGAYVPWHRVINSRGIISARGSVSSAGPHRYDA